MATQSVNDEIKYDDGICEALDRAEEDAQAHVQRYYDSLFSNNIGNGFFHGSLITFHEGPSLPEERDFYCSPRTLDEVEKPDMTPLDHPLRAIAWILNNATVGSKVRVYCYRLTDPIAIDLLIHAGASKVVHVVLQDSLQTRNALKAFVKMYGTVSKRALMKNVEIRMANLTGTLCASRKVQMHDKSIITENYTTFGSYDLSTSARVGNWESLTVVDTRKVHKDKFDEIWDQSAVRKILP